MQAETLVQLLISTNPDDRNLAGNCVDKLEHSDINLLWEADIILSKIPVFDALQYPYCLDDDYIININKLKAICDRERFKIKNSGIEIPEPKC